MIETLTPALAAQSMSGRTAAWLAVNGYLPQKLGSDAAGAVSIGVATMKPYFFWGIVGVPAPLGRLWFLRTEERRPASPTEWAFDIHGRGNIEAANKIARDLARRFGVRITMALTRE